MRDLRLRRNNSGAVQRVIQFFIKPSVAQRIILDSLTYAASKLWNVANYERVNWMVESGIKYPDWYDQKSRLKGEFWYKNLPSQTAQELLKQLDEAWHSYYRLRDTGGIKNPKPPGYKYKNFNIRYLNNGFTIADGQIRLSIPRQQKLYMRQKHGIEAEYLHIPIPDEYKGFKGNVKVIEIIPEKEKFRVNIIIELPVPGVKKDNGIYMSIDMGINNLMTCYISTGKSFIISGRQLLSINRYFDKNIGYYQSIAYADQATTGGIYPKGTKRIKNLYEKRRKQVNHLIHAATRKAISIAEQEDVCRIIIGDISNIRENKDAGKKNNQKFHKWPYEKITKMLNTRRRTAG